MFIGKGVSGNCEMILKAILQYYDCNIVYSEQIIETLLKEYIDSPFIVASINENYPFRGVSPVGIRPTVYAESNGKEYDEMMANKLCFYRARISAYRFKREDMLHIPFNKRGIIGTQRFSIPGVPCMYFSTTSFGTWLEMDMPDVATFQVSGYELPSELKVLNLCIQQLLIDGSSVLMNSEQELRNTPDFLEIFLLVVASSYRVLESDRVLNQSTLFRN